MPSVSQSVGFLALSAVLLWLGAAAPLRADEVAVPATEGPSPAPAADTAPEQQPPADQPKEVPPPKETPPKEAPPPKNLEPLAKADTVSILGKKVRGPAGEDMGRIVDLLLDHNAQPLAVVIDFGGFLGVGSRKIAIDWSLVRFTPDDRDAPIQLSLGKADVQAAPEYKDSAPQPVMVGPPPPPEPAPTPADPPGPPAPEPPQGQQDSTGPAVPQPNAAR